jgi:glycosyltransferase involved in cell wall biosynthesis
MLVAALRVKNEAWVIKYTLSALSEFVDKIVVVDDGSTDATVEICNSFVKVAEVRVKGLNSEDLADEAADWNLLTEMARNHGASWILYTDADEMLEPRIKDFILKLPNLQQYNLIRFRKVSLWKSLQFYRTDLPRFDHKACDTLNPVIVNASCRIKWVDGRGSWFVKLAKMILRGERFKPSLGRGFPLGVGAKVLDVDEILSVHFNHLSMERLIRKQIFYALIEKHLRPRRSREEIINWVSRGWSQEGILLKPIESTWLWGAYINLIDTSDLLNSNTNSSLGSASS